MSLELGVIETIKAEYLELCPIQKDETGILVLRHGEYERNPEDVNAGRLTEKGKYNAKLLLGQAIFNILNKIPKEEQNTLDVLVVASPTEYHGGQRSVETAQEALKAVEEEFTHADLKPSILNDFEFPPQDGLTEKSRQNKPSGSQPLMVENIIEPKFLTESPEFRDFLDAKASEFGFKPYSPQWWAMYEEERYQWVRERLGAEGPDDVGDRLDMSIRDLAQFADNYHTNRPGRRLLIIVATHYDTITTYVKKHIMHVPQVQYIPVSYAGGIGIHISKDGKASTEIGNQTWPVTIEEQS